MHRDISIVLLILMYCKRPIAANVLDRENVSTAFLRSIFDFTIHHFEGLQYATESLGMEKNQKLEVLHHERIWALDLDIKLAFGFLIVESF